MQLYFDINISEKISLNCRAYFHTYYNNGLQIIWDKVDIHNTYTEQNLSWNKESFEIYIRNLTKDYNFSLSKYDNEALQLVDESEEIYNEYHTDSLEATTLGIH